MSPMASQITSLGIVYSTVYSGADQRKHQSSAWLAFVWRIHRGPVNSPHKRPVTRKMFSFDDVIMCWLSRWYLAITMITSNLSNWALGCRRDLKARHHASVGMYQYLMSYFLPYHTVYNIKCQSNLMVSSEFVPMYIGTYMPIRKNINKQHWIATLFSFKITVQL